MKLRGDGHLKPSLSSSLDYTLNTQDLDFPAQPTFNSTHGACVGLFPRADSTTNVCSLTLMHAVFKATHGAGLGWEENEGGCQPRNPKPFNANMSSQVVMLGYMSKKDARTYFI